jgi:hypothetical protein
MNGTPLFKMYGNRFIAIHGLKRLVGRIYWGMHAWRENTLALAFILKQIFQTIFKIKGQKR